MHIKRRRFLDKLFLTVLILAIPLYQKFPLLSVAGTFTKIRLEDLLMLALLIYTSLLYLPKLRTFLNGNIERRIVIFLGVGIVSLLSAVYVTRTVDTGVAILHWARRIEYLLPLFFALSFPRESRKEYTEYIFKLLLIAIFAAFLYGFGQKHLNWPVIVTQNEEYSKGIALRYVPGAHITSTFAGHYDLASFLALVLPLIAAGLFTSKDRVLRIMSGLGMVFGLWLLANSLSRISVASYLVSVSFALLFMKKIKALVLVVVVSLVVFSFSSALLDRYLSIIQVVKDGVKEIMMITVPSAHAAGPYLPGGNPFVLAAEDRSTSIRLNVEWPRAIRALIKNPILGTGYSSITLATDNDYLRLIGEVGLTGFAAFMLMIATIIEYAFVGLKKGLAGLPRAYVFGFSGAIFGVLVNAFFIDIFEASKFAIIFWLLAGVFIYLVRTEADEKNIKIS